MANIGIIEGEEIIAGLMIRAPRITADAQELESGLAICVEIASISDGKREMCAALKLSQEEALELASVLKRAANGRGNA